MLLPQSLKKSEQKDHLPPLETPEDCRRAEERDEALTKRAKRREAEVVADRASFELARDKVTFSIELALAVVLLIAAAAGLALNPELIPVALLGGGGIGGVVAFLRRKPAED
ncbi:MAG TPA: hypothetical protein VNM41_01735 [Solirubrobacterales bacterium]|nr:hypothetical protein [Solirubrobacterales bacterium]